MAKKKTATPKKTTKGTKAASNGSFNLSQAIRDNIQKHPDWTAKQVIEQIQKENPKESINVGTAGVTWSNERKKLGLSKGRGKAKKGTKSSIGGSIGTGRSAGGKGGTGYVANAVELIKTAKSLIAQCGSTRAAKALLDEF